VTEGTLTIGGYELRNCVATGSSTQIWEVNEQGSTVQLAMKLLLEEAHKDPAMKAVLKHEFKVGSSFDHPSFLKFHRIEINRDHGFFIMDYFRSPSLKSHIATNRAGVQSSFKKLAESLCLAYQHMHEKGWLHRDIKPDNILVNKAGEARVIDFSLSSRVMGGLGKLFAGKQKTIQGTRTYIAPETILKKPPTPLTDQYSLGVTFYETLTGGPPFAGASPNDLLKKHLGEAVPEPSTVNPNVTPELDKLIVKMMAKKPQDRYDSMQEVASALRGITCFKEDPLQRHERQLQESKDEMAASVDKRLDSRADAERTAKGIAAPAKPRKRKPTPAMLKELERMEEEKRQKEQQAAAAQQPMMPGYMPGMMPGMMPPQMPYPAAMPQMQYGMPMPQMPPGQMHPGQMMPQMPPGQMPPGQQMPQQPAQMPQQPAAAPPQQGTTPPQQPAAPPQQQAVPAQPQAPAAQPPAAQPPVQPEKPGKDLEEANEDDLMSFLDLD
jgi:serine/threonine-protein kinase